MYTSLCSAINMLSRVSMFLCIHPSIYFLPLIQFRVALEVEALPSHHRARGRVQPGQFANTQRPTTICSHIHAQIRITGYLTSISSHCRRNTEQPQPVGGFEPRTYHFLNFIKCSFPLKTSILIATNCHVVQVTDHHMSRVVHMELPAAVVKLHQHVLSFKLCALFAFLNL